MANPFPGMNPYLENTFTWQGFHNAFVAFLCEAVQPLLPRNYVATVELRVYVDQDADYLTGRRTTEPRIPDLEVTTRRVGTLHPASQQIAPTDAPLRGTWIDVLGLEHREAYLEIITLPERQVVTSVELLSPTNKGDSTGFKAYKTKQRETLDAAINLVEIDLLRGGRHTLAVPPGAVEHLRPFACMVCSYRAVKPWGFEVFARSLRETLPAITLPLLPESPEVEVDLQAVFTRTHNAGAFDRLLDYNREPTPPLAPEDAAWADALLREAGLRGAPSA